MFADKHRPLANIPAITARLDAATKEHAMSNLTITFDTPGDDFEATREAEAFLRDAGFSLGVMERGEPRGILFGEYVISKWRNLRMVDENALHGAVTHPSHSPRTGPVVVTIYERAPKSVKRAFHDAAVKLRGPDATASFDLNKHVARVEARGDVRNEFARRRGEA